MPEVFETALIEKRNVLNELRANNLTLQELRFFSIYLSKINPRNKDTRIVRFTLADFQKIMQFGKLNIKQLKESTNSLLRKIVNIPLESGGYEGVVLFEKCKVDKDRSGEWYVEISASTAALPLMFDFKDKYFKYELWNALRLNSANQIRMYEILKQYENIGKREISVDDLQELLGVKYSRWDKFRQSVLDNCQKALKATTDICYTYEKGKGGKGGKWLTIIFYIYKNVPESTEITLLESELTGYIDISTEHEEKKEELSETLQNMIMFADDLTKNEIKEIYYAMQEKGYSDIYLSFKRLYQTAVNNDPDDLKKYILGIIRKEKIETNSEQAEDDSDIEKYKVLINQF